MCQLSPVTFHGDTIFCVDFQGQPFTPAKPIVENMGLNWPSQTAKLNANRKRWGVAIIATPSDGGEQQTLCLPVRKLPAFFASINPRKVKPELRPRIELYQAECDDALWDYWTKGRSERQPAALPSDASITPDQQCTLQAIVKARIEALPEAQRKGRGLYPQIWSRFNNHFRLARYCQLPQTRMSEAIEYLTQMELTPAKALPSAPLPRPARPQSDGLPPEALAAMTGSQRAKRFRRLMEEVRGLAQKVGSTMDMVRFTTLPGARYVRLAPELDARYNALDQMHKIAVAGLYQAEHMLYCLYFLGEGVEFK